MIQILPPEGYKTRLHAKEGKPCCTANDLNMILDLAETERINEDEPPKKEGSKLIWRIRKPFVGYKYQINFEMARS